MRRAILLLSAALSSACSSAEAPPAPAAEPAATAPAQGRLFVTNESGGDISVVDVGAQKVVATIPVGKRPRGIRLSPDGTTALRGAERLADGASGRGREDAAARGQEGRRYRRRERGGPQAAQGAARRIGPRADRGDERRPAALRGQRGHRAADGAGGCRWQDAGDLQGGRGARGRGAAPGWRRHLRDVRRRQPGVGDRRRVVEAAQDVQGGPAPALHDVPARQQPRVRDVRERRIRGGRGRARSTSCSRPSSCRAS